MKFLYTTNRLALIGLFALLTISSFAQGKRLGLEKDRHSPHHHKRDHRVTPIHTHHQHIDVQHVHKTPWIRNHAHKSKVRYVYFNDYNVYYDYQRSAYLTLSGRNWIVSTEKPLAMRRAHVSTVRYLDVDYYGDDFYHYHNRRFPAARTYCRY